MPIIPLYQVDAFTAEPFRGNPAAVCLLDTPLPTETMQAIAAEMNLSETAFVQPLDDGPWSDADRFTLRWFTPLTEVNLCGHATLATAAVLFTEVGVRAETLRLETRSGTLMAQRAGDEVRLDFPADAPVPCPMPEGIAAALGDPTVVAVARGNAMGMLLVHLADAEDLARLQPDYAPLLAASDAACAMGVIVTARAVTAKSVMVKGVTANAVTPYDFVSRFFAPAVGVNEDPVTGSAHILLGPYWSNLLGRGELLAYQASPRGGMLRVAILPDDRIGLQGRAVVVFSGELRLQD